MRNAIRLLSPCQLIYHMVIIYVCHCINIISADEEGTLMTRNTIQRSSLLLEIGTEDIPARFLPSAIQQLKENTETIFKDNHIRFSEVKTLGSPRRLTVIAHGIPPMQETGICAHGSYCCFLSRLSQNLLFRYQIKTAAILSDV